MSDIVERLRGTATHLESGEPGRAVEISYADMREAAAEIEQLRAQLEQARDYVNRAIVSYEGDPADNNFQRGFLAALEVVRDEAFSPLPSTKSTSEEKAFIGLPMWLLRGGPGRDFPCLESTVTECAMSECQARGACRMSVAPQESQPSPSAPDASTRVPGLPE